MCSPTSSRRPSENWDADFEFQQGNHLGERDAGSRPLSVISNTAAARISDAISRDLDWGDDDEPIKRYPSNAGPAHANADGLALFSHPHTRFLNWSESSPSTPTKHSRNTESWDDDFELKQDSPLSKLPSHPLDAARRVHRQSDASFHRRRHRSSLHESDPWMDSLRDENDVSPTKRTRDHVYTDSSDDDDELGFAAKDEDKTITARLRPRATFSHPSPPPPVPSLPASILASHPTTHEPFPRSPTDSSFSTQMSPTPGRNSAASMTNLALRRTMSGASSTLALLPPSPPIHRERRRLRKKSRPPHLDGTIPEPQDQFALPPQPSSPTCPSTPEPSSAPPASTPDRLASPGSQKMPLMTRIGSVKKWGTRKKRESTTPSEFSQDPDGSDSPAQPAKNGRWFFRNTSESVTSSTETEMTERRDAETRYPILNPRCDAPVAEDSLASRLGKRRSFAFVNMRRRDQAPDEPDIVQPQVLQKPRRPASMQPYAKPRDTSHPNAVPSSVTLPPTQLRTISSMSVEDLGSNPHRQSSRKVSGGGRKVSLTNAGKSHSRTHSSGATGLVHLLPVKFSASKDVPPKIGHDHDAQPPTGMPRSSTTLQSHDNQQSLKRLPVTQPDTTLFMEPPATDSHLAFIPSLPIGIAAGTLTPKASVIPQTASLGRSTPPLSVSKSAAILRRNSLSDLKIPTRISEAQVGLRRDLRMVREFAANVEREHQSTFRLLVVASDVRILELKMLEATYASLSERVRSLIASREHLYAPLPIAPQPSIAIKTRPRSNTDTSAPKLTARHLASALDNINSRYLITWECAALLIELGGGARTPVSSPPVSMSEPAMSALAARPEVKKNRERAITLAGEESKPNPILAAGPLTPTDSVNLARHASTERHPLNRRQLHLLEEILKNNDSRPAEPLPVVEETPPNREWRWGDAMSSTITLPSDSSQGGKKKRSNRLRMNGLRNMLRSLKRTYVGDAIPVPLHPAVTGAAQDQETSNACQHQIPKPVLNQRRRAKTTADTQPPSRGQKIMPNRDTFLKQPVSSRRPSLASIFRLGQRNKATSVTSSVDNVQSITTQSSGRDSCSITDDGDWDRLESSSDVDAAEGTQVAHDRSNTSGTLRGRSPYLKPGHLPSPLASRDPSHSQTSVVPGQALGKPPPPVDPGPGKVVAQASPSTPRSQTVGDPVGPPILLPQPTHEANDLTLPPPRLAMTPENIQPLLENSKDVISRLQGCITEMQLLLDADVAFVP